MIDLNRIKKYHGRSLSDFQLLPGEGIFKGFCRTKFYKGLDNEIVAADWGDSFDDFQIVLLKENGGIDEIVTIGELTFPGHIHLFDDDILERICNEGFRFY